MLPKCERGFIRAGCGGTSTGTCVFNCRYGNCFKGPDQATWFGSVKHWSLDRFPSYAQDVYVADYTANLMVKARGAAKKLMIDDDGEVDVHASLQIGPTTCETGFGCPTRPRTRALGGMTRTRVGVSIPRAV